MNQFKIGIQNYENLHNVLKDLGLLVQNIIILILFELSSRFMLTCKVIQICKYRNSLSDKEKIHIMQC